MKKLFKAFDGTFINIDYVNYIQIETDAYVNEWKLFIGLENRYIEHLHPTESFKTFVLNLRNYSQLYFFSQKTFDKKTYHFLNLKKCVYVSLNPYDKLENIESIKFFFKVYTSRTSTVDFINFTDDNITDIKRSKIDGYLNQMFDIADENINDVNEFFNS